MSSHSEEAPLQLHQDPEKKEKKSKKDKKEKKDKKDKKHKKDKKRKREYGEEELEKMEKEILAEEEVVEKQQDVVKKKREQKEQAKERAKLEEEERQRKIVEESKKFSDSKKQNLYQQLHMGSKGKKQKSEGNQEYEDSIAKQIEEKMTLALETDHENIRKRIPALERFKCLKEIELPLRKSNIQSPFLEDGSLEVFERWLDMLPDKTYPNNTLVLKLLEILDRMDISSEALSGNQCHTVVAVYTREDMGNQQIRQLARNIVARWDRIKYGGFADDNAPSYENFQNKIKGSVGMAGEVQRKARIGVVLPQRNAFDFTMAPESNYKGKEDARSKLESSSKQEIMKTLQKIKKDNTQTQNSNMKTVKIEI